MNGNDNKDKPSITEGLVTAAKQLAYLDSATIIVRESNKPEHRNLPVTEFALIVHNLLLVESAKLNNKL